MMELNPQLRIVTSESTKTGPCERSFGANVDQDGRPSTEMRAVQRLYDTQTMELRGFISMCRTFEQNQVERVAKWKDEAEKLAKSLESKRCELARRELELKNIRGKLLKCESSKWIPEEDQSIQHAVQDLQLTIRSWAKDCSVKSFSDVLDTERLPEESSFLRRVSECSVYKEHSQFEGLEHPFLLLAAFLSEVIRVTVWGDPFFHFQNLNAEHAYSFAGGLNKTFYGMRDGK
ncbi:uncharacterized protein J3D65DRAFT_301206 [Phyllosticta citribraziliensis]|uniref:Uncharacterized protein n=1 Tax=Phyllosticta citribraziliensis TaxID=989973 RepID=A0ABR1LXH6_9PEZI